MTISATVEPNHTAVLNGLIKANNWIFAQINKTIPEGLVSLSAMSTGTDGVQIFADHNVRISNAKGCDDDLTLTTSVDIERNRLHVCLYRQEDLADVELSYMPELTDKVTDAFLSAGIITH